MLHSSGLAQYNHTVNGKEKSFFAALFIDFSKAYDRVELPILQKTMETLGIEPRYRRFIQSWMTDRSLIVRINEENSKNAHISRGLPQGSSLSVLLWQIYIADIPIPEPSSALYMDDAVTWSVMKTREKLERAMQTKLDCLGKWCNTKNIIINTDKTVVMVNDMLNEITLQHQGKDINTVAKTHSEKFSNNPKPWSEKTT